MDLGSVHLIASQLSKLRDQLEKLAQSQKIQSSLGLLMWATSTCQHLRPYLAPLYKDLRSEPVAGAAFARASRQKQSFPSHTQACR